MKHTHAHSYTHSYCDYSNVYTKIKNILLGSIVLNAILYYIQTKNKYNFVTTIIQSKIQHS